MPASAARAESARLGGVQSLERAFGLLRLLAGHNAAGLALPELVAQSGIDRTTAHRMMRFLESAGYVEREAAGKRFHLGPAAMALGLRALNRTAQDSPLVVKMKALARLTGDTVFLIARLGDHGHCLHTEEGSHRIKSFHMLTGTSRLLGQGTGSMALLAALDNEDIAAHFARHRAEYEAGGLSLLKLQRGVERCRKQGYALAGAEGVAGIGYVLPPPMGADAAISIVSTVSRMPASRRHEIGGVIAAMFA